MQSYFELMILIGAVAVFWKFVTRDRPILNLEPVSDEDIGEEHREKILHEVAGFVRESGWHAYHRSGFHMTMKKPKQFSLFWSLFWFMFIPVVGVIPYVLWYSSKNDEYMDICVTKYGEVTFS